MSGSAPRSPESPVGDNGETSVQAHTCPMCGKLFRYRDWKDVPTFPFCSLACKQQDLGVWLTDGYAINTSLVTGEHEASPGEGDDEGDSDDNGKSDDDQGD